MEEKITYEDVEEYKSLFTLAPPFILEGFAKKNSNLIGKFKSGVENYLDDLNDEERKKLNMILASDIDYLQEVMAEAYEKTEIKQFQILSNPSYKEFIEINFEELRNMI